MVNLPGYRQAHILLQVKNSSSSSPLPMPLAWSSRIPQIPIWISDSAMHFTSFFQVLFIHRLFPLKFRKLPKTKYYFTSFFFSGFAHSPIISIIFNLDIFQKPSIFPRKHAHNAFPATPNHFVRNPYSTKGWMECCHTCYMHFSGKLILGTKLPVSIWIVMPLHACLWL